MERPVTQDPGVVHHGVDSTERVDRALHDRRAAIGSRDVVVVGNGYAARGDDLLDDGFGGVGLRSGAVERGAEVVHHDLRAAPPEKHRVAAAEPATGSGDDDDAIFDAGHQAPTSTAASREAISDTNTPDCTTSSFWFLISCPIRTTPRPGLLVGLVSSTVELHVDRVAELDDAREAPVFDAKESQVRPAEDAGLNAEPRGDREHEEAVRDRLAVGQRLAELAVDVQRVEVAGHAGEGHHVRLGDRPCGGRERRADLEVLEVHRVHLAPRRVRADEPRCP